MEQDKVSDFIDDISIRNEMELWRLVGPNIFINGQPKIYIVRDERHEGKCRPSSLAFSNTRKNRTDTGCMSVFIAKIVEASGRESRDIISDFKPYVASLTAGAVRSKPINQIITRSQPSDEIAHADVYGKKNKTVQEAMAKACTWKILPPIDAC